MPRVALLIAIGLATLTLVGAAAHGRDPLVVVFYQEGCPDCALMRTALDSLAADHPDLAVTYHELSEPGAGDLLLRLVQPYGPMPAALPVIFVGDGGPISGAGQAQELALREAVEACLAAACPSPMARAGGPVIAWLDVLVAGGLVVLFFLLFLLRGP